jgi:riboflavin biosynthesis pyrimidine reductase
VQELRAHDEVTDLLEPYRRAQRRRDDGRPWVLANMVAGLDGSTAIDGRVGKLSSPTDAELFRLLRSVADVVLVGARTVREERYGPVRLPAELRAEREAAGRPPVPALAVVTRSLDLDPAAPAFAEADPASPTIIVTCEAADAARRSDAEARGPVVVAGADRVEPTAALAALAGRGAGVVLCEGGPTLLGELLAADLLDELCLTLAPVTGGDPLPVAVTPPEGGVLRRHRLAHTLVDDGSLFLRYERGGSHDGSNDGSNHGSEVADGAG